MMLAFLNALSPWHLLLIGVVAVVLFGNRLPEVARSLGRSVNEFKRGLRDVKDEFDNAATDDPPREKLQAPSKDNEVVDQEPKAEAKSEATASGETSEPR